MVNTVTDEASGTSYQVPVLGGEGLEDLKYVGDMNSEGLHGLEQHVPLRDFSLGFLIDFRFGGKVLSMTEAALDGWGVSQRTADARDRGYVEREGVRFTDVQKYYDLVGATNYNSQYNSEDYVYDATNVRMREISFGYTFRDLFGRSRT